MKIYKKIFKFFDRLEDRVRGKLTHYPLTYAFIGSIGIVSIWRGIWEIEDDLNMTGVESLVFGILITMITGLFVSFFIGDKIIISGIKQEKRIDEKTEEEIKKEEAAISEIQADIKEIKNEIKEI